MRREGDVANACEVLAVCEWMDLFARIYIVCLHIYSGACTQAGVGIPKSRVPSWYGPGTGDQPTRPEYSRVPSWYGPVTTNQWHACVLSSLRRGPRLSTDSHQPSRGQVHGGRCASCQPRVSIGCTPKGAAWVQKLLIKHVLHLIYRLSTQRNGIVNTVGRYGGRGGSHIHVAAPPSTGL